MIIKVKDKEHLFNGYANPINSVQKVAEECYEQGRADAIDEFVGMLDNPWTTDAILCACDKFKLKAIFKRIAGQLKGDKNG